MSSIPTPSWRRLARRFAKSLVFWAPTIQVFLRPVSGQDSTDAVTADWSRWCEDHAGSRCDVGLSSHWLLTAAFSKVDGPDSVQALKDHALAQWAHYRELSAASVDQSWVLRSTLTPQVALVCAAPKALIDTLRAVAQQHRVTLQWVGPWWARDAQAWVQALAPGASALPLQAWEPGLVTYVALDAAREGAQASVGQVWTEVSDATQTPPTPLALGDGTAQRLVSPWPDLGVSVLPSRAGSGWRMSWADALDFVGPRIPTALASWALLVASLAACMAVSEQVQQVWHERDDAQIALHRLQRAQHQQTVARTPPRMISAPGQAGAATLDAQALRHAARMAQLMAYPWAPLIERVEQAASGEAVVLTGFSVDLSSLAKADAAVDVRLQASVRDDASALRWVQAHGDGVQLLSREPLSTPFDAASGHYELRAEALWVVGTRP